MLDTRAILLAAATVTGLTAPVEAEALTPYPVSLALDPDLLLQLPSEHLTPAPQAEPVFEPRARVTNRRANLQCVPFARRESGVELYGDASTWWQQASGRYQTANTPSEGAVLVMHGYANDNRGHVAVIKDLISPRIMVVDHANWLNGGEITRDVPIMDVSEAGDWSEVRVWNVPGRHWGGRTYRVQGFILSARVEADDAEGSARLAQQQATDNSPTG
ncbi:MAG: CHAP domain-containing protein [Hyphomonadaceae bacterium]|nr:CHAP domain-containing protein [Hyphomonadaceae bacterium]